MNRRNLSRRWGEERPVPGLFEKRFNLLEHRSQYCFASGLLPASCRLLDLGSGEGYGAVGIAGDARRVFGTDVSVEPLSHAGTAYPLLAGRLTAATAVNLPFRRNSFEAVVSIHVIEHVRDDDGFVSEVRRVLAPGGIFIAATPNRLTRPTLDGAPCNPFHVREYSPEEFKKLLENKFNDVALFGMHEARRVWRHRQTRYLIHRFLERTGTIAFIPPPARPLLEARMADLLACFLPGISRVRSMTEADYPIRSENVESSVSLVAVCRL